jgi:HK97 family phage major capsid protein
MDTLRRRLNAELQEGNAKADAIFDAVKAEGERELTAEELSALDTWTARKDAIKSQLAALDRQRDEAGATHEARGGIVQSVHDNREDKPWGIGEFLQAVAIAETDRSEMDPRLAKLQVGNGYRMAASGANQGAGSEGGFLVSTQFSDALLDRAREESPILSMCRSIPIDDGASELDLPVIDETSRATGSRWGGVQVYRAAEAATVTATKPAFGKLKLTTSKIMGLAYATDELLRNARALGAIFGDAFSSEFAFKVTNEIFRGVGGDECLGVIAGPCTVDQAKETNQEAATINTKNLSKMWMHLPARSKPRSVWLINNECEPELDELTVPAGTGAVEPRIVTYGPEGALRIKGRPVMQVEQCEALGTSGDIMLADFSEYLLAPKGTLEQQESMHVRFIYGEQTFRWTYFINGRPAWLSTVTPFKGSATIAPFVTLATRA